MNRITSVGYSMYPNLEAEDLGSISGSLLTLLCGLGQVTAPFWCSFSILQIKKLDQKTFKISLRDFPCALGPAAVTRTKVPRQIPSKNLFCFFTLAFALNPFRVVMYSGKQTQTSPFVTASLWLSEIHFSQITFWQWHIEHLQCAKTDSKRITGNTVTLKARACSKIILIKHQEVAKLPKMLDLVRCQHSRPPRCGLCFYDW